MGTFEKLGILVIVVIIVMILAVAIYQWGGAAEPAIQTPDLPDPLTIRYLEELETQPDEAGARSAKDPAADADKWPGGVVPRVYVIQPNDKVWVLVFKRWKLKDTFIQAIAAANPTVNVKKVLPGTKLVIPDPARYKRKPGAGRSAARAGTRRYVIEEGDNLESIANRHLGSRQRWTDIVDLNPGLNPHRLMPGQEIHLPVK